jgi:hypothetical protein
VVGELGVVGELWEWCRPDREVGSENVLGMKSVEWSKVV